MFWDGTYARRYAGLKSIPEEEEELSLSLSIDE
jgi:hypothetical protein